MGKIIGEGDRPCLESLDNTLKNNDIHIVFSASFIVLMGGSFQSSLNIFFVCLEQKKELLRYMAGGKQFFMVVVMVASIRTLSSSLSLLVETSFWSR
jgi:hypothetical protein